MAGFREVLAVEWDAHAVECFKLNFPEVPVYHGDIKALSVEDVLARTGLAKGELDVLDGSPPCFPAGTPITTERGPVPIENINVGDRVLTHRGVYRAVTEKFDRAYRGELVTVRTKYGRAPITSTPEHPYYVRRRGTATRDCNGRKNGSRYKVYGDPEWSSAEDLRVGDLVLAPHALEGQGPPPTAHSVLTRTSRSASVHTRAAVVNAASEKMAWIFGFYLAEGWRRGRDANEGLRGATRRSVTFGVATHEAPMLRDKLRALGYVSCASTPKRGSVKVEVASLDLWAALGEFGHGAGAKCIPEWCHSMPRPWRVALLAGYFEGDGCDRTKATAGSGVVTKATTISRLLADGIARMVASTHDVLASVGVLYEAGESVIEGRVVSVQRAYGVSYTHAGSSRARPGVVTAEGAWVPVTSVTSAPVVGTRVYNMEVEEHHSYVAEGLAVHNCQGFSTAGKRKFDDPRNSLFREYVRLVQGLQPRAFVMENVSGMVKGGMKLIFADAMRELRACGYRVACRLLDASYLGVPQARQRVIFVGIREDLGLEPEHPLPGETPIRSDGALSSAIALGAGALNFALTRSERGALGSSPMPTLQKDGMANMARHQVGVAPRGAQQAVVGLEATRSQAINPFMRAKGPAATITKTATGYQAVTLGTALGVSQGAQWVQNPQGGMTRSTETPSVTLTTRANYHAVRLPVKAALGGKTTFASPMHDATVQDNVPARSITKIPMASGQAPDWRLPMDAWSKDPALAFLPARPLSGRVLADALRLLCGQGAGVFNPSGIRGLSVGEARRLCSFPDEFQLTGKWAEAWARLGNSVPPLMMRQVALRVRGILERAKLEDLD